MSTFQALANGGLSWEIELTTRCNSHCIGCSRYSDYFHTNTHFDPRLDLSFETLKKALASSEKLDFILFCGVYGDPLLHPEIETILQHIRNTYGDIKVSAHTNGSFANREFWQNLGSYFKSPGSHVKFSMDGLKSSHELFRQGTRWDHTLKNAQTFIEAGGNAVWKMIEFKHNQHEVDEARRISVELGFKKFELRQNNFPGLDNYITMNPADRKDLPRENITELNEHQLEEWNQLQIQQKRFETIECSSLSRRNLYLDAHGDVWPCCWIGGLPYRPEENLRQWTQKKLLSKHSPHFNSIATSDLANILAHEWFSKHLPESWSQRNPGGDNPLFATCAKTCGKCSS